MYGYELSTKGKTDSQNNGTLKSMFLNSTTVLTEQGDGVTRQHKHPPQIARWIHSYLMIYVPKADI